MTTYQLSCGHWQTECDIYGIGAILACLKCGSTRTIVIGFASSANLAPVVNAQDAG